MSNAFRSPSQKIASDKARQAALKVILQFEKNGNVRLKAESLLQKAFHPLSVESPADQGFARRLIQGVLHRWFVYDAWLEKLSGRPLKKLQPNVRALLRLGFCQLEAHTVQVPAYAAINTTVDLARLNRLSSPSIRFINALLRSSQRGLADQSLQGPLIEAVQGEESQMEALLWQVGWPKPFTVLLQKAYSSDELKAMAQTVRQPPPFALRINTLKTSLSDYHQALQQAGFVFEPMPDLAEGLWLNEAPSGVQSLPGYETGAFYVQDASSMWVSHVLNPLPGEWVLDLCAAPGSKTTHMAALMQNQGRIMALEPKPERVQRLQENLSRLGVTNTQVTQADALVWEPEATMLFDKVLVDAPCSGSGTIRRHPEILLALRQPNFKEFQTLQMELLRKAFTLLKPGGQLVYSTCSIFAEENTQLIQQFLAQTPQAKLDFEMQRLIQEKADGFYAARLINQ